METSGKWGARAFAHFFLPTLLLAAGLATLCGGTAIDSLAVLLTARLTLLGFERIYPNQERWNYPLWRDWKATARELGADLVYWASLTWIPFSLAMRPLRRAIGSFGESHGVAIWPSDQPLVVRALLFLVLAELCTYWYHRFAHRARVLWQFHSVHHMPDRMNCFKNDRNHLMDFFLAGVSTLPLVLLGAKAEETIAALTFSEVAALAAHANIRVKCDWLTYFFITPNYHLRHHSVVLGESNSNFGCRITIFDRIFGTFRGPASEEYVARVEVGVVGEPPNAFLPQLVRPFYHRIGETGE